MTSHGWIRTLPSYRLYGVGPFDSRLVMSYVIALALVAAAFVTRWALDASLPAGFPFLTFFPAVMIAAFWTGLWPAVLAGGIGLCLSWYFFIPPFQSFKVSGGVVLALGFYLFIVAVDVFLTHLAIGAVVESDGAKKAREDLAKFQEILIKELDHRIKNLFSVVASLVKLSARYASSPAELADDASARIMALGRSHSSLWRTDQDADATVQSIARQVLEPFIDAHAGRIRITGKSPVLDVRLVQILSLVFHELATNAMKYGALTHDEGEVFISSSAAGSKDVTVVWAETGIFVDEEPSRKGFGTELIERLINGAGGQIDRTFEVGKMTATLSFSTL